MAMLSAGMTMQVLLGSSPWEFMAEAVHVEPLLTALQIDSWLNIQGQNKWDQRSWLKMH